MTTKTKILFETYDGLTATAEVICRLATEGFHRGPVHQDYLRNTALGAAYSLKDRGFDARVEDDDVADRAIVVTAQDSVDVQFKWVERDGEEGYEVVKITNARW